MPSQPSDILHKWRQLAPKPGGKLLFSLLLGRSVRYTGSIRPRVLTLEPGHAVVAMADRAAVRNHLRSIHAVALANLAEVSSGLALLAGLPPDARAILTGLSVEYLKKARGRLTSECRMEPITEATARELTLESILRDADGNVVARGHARWKVGPNSERSRS